MVEDNQLKAACFGLAQKPTIVDPDNGDCVAESLTQVLRRPRPTWETPVRCTVLRSDRPEQRSRPHRRRRTLEVAPKSTDVVRSIQISRATGRGFLTSGPFRRPPARRAPGLPRA